MKYTTSCHEHCINTLILLVAQPRGFSSPCHVTRSNSAREIRKVPAGQKRSWGIQIPLLEALLDGEPVGATHLEFPNHLVDMICNY